MQLTQQDYDARKQRVEDGTGDDEDARLVKHYESEGFEWRGKSSKTSSEATPSSGAQTPSDRQSTAPTTGNPSNLSETGGDSTARPTDGAGQKAGSSTRSKKDADGR